MVNPLYQLLYLCILAKRTIPRLYSMEQRNPSQVDAPVLIVPCQIHMYVEHVSNAFERPSMPSQEGAVHLPSNRSSHLGTDCYKIINRCWIHKIINVIKLETIMKGKRGCKGQ